MAHSSKTASQMDYSEEESDLEEEEEQEDVEEGSSEEDQSEEDEEAKRTAIRKELADLSFEELEALKAKIGTKEWNEAMFGKASSSSNVSTKKRKKNETFKRDNKNRPRELSAKIRVPKVRDVVPVQKKWKRDPRFESVCGELNEKIWAKNYEFINDMRSEEKERLQEQLKQEEDPEQRAEIKKSLHKLTNKERSDAVKREKEEKQRAEKEENIKRLKEGKKPYYMKKSTKKYLELAEKYDDLKASGKLESYLKKKRQKNAIRDKKTLKLPKPS